MRGSIKPYKGKNRTTWQLVVELGIDPLTKKRKQKRITVQGTKKEAEVKLREILRQLDTGAFADPGKVTFGEFLIQWLRTYAEPNLAARTYEGYKMIIEKHIIPALGTVPLAKLQPMHLQEYYSSALTSGRKDKKTDSLGKGLSPTTVLQHHRIMRESLKHALRWQMVVRNVADAVEPPRKVKKEMQTLDENQVRQLLVNVKESYIYMPVFLAVSTGMRMGEVLGLAWDDVDLSRGVIRVRQSLQQRKVGEVVFREPKTHKSRRQIEISQSVAKVIKDYKKEQSKWKLAAGELWKEYGLVCTMNDGRPVNPATLSNTFREAAKRCFGYPVRFHDLRHTTASLLLKAGTHPKVVADILGHATTNLTLDTYSHLLPGLGMEAAKRISIAVLGSKNKASVTKT